MKSKTFEQHLQESCGGGYSFADILNNLESEELIGCLGDFLEERKENTVSFNRLQLIEFIQRIRKDFEE